MKERERAKENGKVTDRYLVSGKETHTLKAGKRANEK